MTMYNVPFGFKWAAKITNCVSTPVKDNSITPAWHFAVTYFDITVEYIYTSNTKLERILTFCSCSLWTKILTERTTPLLLVESHRTAAQISVQKYFLRPMLKMEESWPLRSEDSESVGDYCWTHHSRPKATFVTLSSICLMMWFEMLSLGLQEGTKKVIIWKRPSFCYKCQMPISLIIYCKLGEVYEKG